jgi:hypothetical protein
MDERKRTIRELREQRQEDLSALSRLLEELGAALLERLAPPGEAGEPAAPETPGAADDIPGTAGGGAGIPAETAGEKTIAGAPLDEQTGVSVKGRGLSHARGAIPMPSPEDTADYHRYLREIGDCEGDIRSINAGIIRLKELEDAVRQAEGACSEGLKTMSGLYTRLGEFVLEAPCFAEFAEPYRKQLDDLVLKVRSLEDRLDGLTEGGEANFFSWIGKGAQSVVIRSFLGKNQKNIQRIFTAAGEQFTRSAFREGDADAGFRDILNEIEEGRRVQAELTGELARLREERRRTGESLSSGGSPQRRIRALERQILHAREQLRGVYLRYGTRLEGAPSHKGLGDLLTADDRFLTDRIRQLRKSIRDHEGRIEILEASLAIDEEREGIAKKEKAIVEQRQRIALSEKTIADLTGQIEEARRRIEELSRKL